MATKQEKEDMSKALKNIDNKWEAFAFVWAYRQKEIKNVIIMIESTLLAFMILKYTSVIAFLYKYIEKLVK